jgi:hypothetical protein
MLCPQSHCKDAAVARSRTPFSGIVIANRGNISGRDPDRENHPAYVQAALKAGWHVCVDVFFQHGTFFLPHAPVGNRNYSPLPPAFFSNQRVWSRALEPTALDALCNINAHCFMFNAEPTLTSAQFIWTPYPGFLTDRSIAVMSDSSADFLTWLDSAEPAGLCSDEPSRYI